MIWTAPLRDHEGRIRGAIAIDNDISQQKMLEEQFRQSQKLEAIGRLAGGVAHDFNNLLTVIQGYNEMAAMEARNLPKILECTREVEYASGRATALTGQLLAFSRRQISQPKILDLNEIVTHSMKLLRRVIGEDIEIVTHLDPQLWRVSASSPTSCPQYETALRTYAPPGGWDVTQMSAIMARESNCDPTARRRTTAGCCRSTTSTWRG